jgi:5-methylcytosine-specific restriction protein B
MAQSLEQALLTFDHKVAADRNKVGEETRKIILSKFPEDGWPTMSLERYALGQADSADTYCRWLEFKSTDLGSISGGSSIKLIIYKHKDKEGWYFPPGFENERKAWEKLRTDVVTMLDRAHEGRWDELQELMPFQFGPALWLKTLFVYVPGEILPVYSTNHLAGFRYRLSGVPTRTSTKLGPIALNRTLLSELRAQRELQGFSAEDLGQFLYHWADPRNAVSIFKIAPGEDGKLWEECRKGEYAAVGWPAVGDLSTFENAALFTDKFRAAYGPSYGDTPAGKATTTRKAKEVWSLTQIEPGDLIVANQGTSKILAVGEVQDPPYEWGGRGNEHPHRIRVKWDTSRARTIPAQQKWAFVTVAPVPIEQYERLLASGEPVESVAIHAAPSTQVDRELATLADRLEERKQLILYGPPGTGKTYTARRFLLHWLLSQEGKQPGEFLADPHRTKEEWKRLTTAPTETVAQVTMVTFHPSYGYEDFVEGFRPVESNDSGLRLSLVDGIFKRVCSAAARERAKPFVLFIDEINRGNLPRIFGELITVLEADKRETEVYLPQSKKGFSVPENVYIVGTMNTADRSIKVLDAAIRRRFAFHELMPDSSLLAGQRFGALALDDLLDHLNTLIASKIGREKQIGHSFFLVDDEPVSDIDEFAKRFRYEVIPLLQEYCYEDYRALADYLGTELVDRDAQEIRTEVLDRPDALAAALARFVNTEDSQ